MKECKIYVLKDPITRKVRYVGKTVSSLNSRRSAHIAKAVADKDNLNDEKTVWINSLLLIGRLPIIKEIDTAPYDEAIKKEFDWIIYYSNKGLKLLNKHGLGERCIHETSEVHRRKKSVNKDKVTLYVPIELSKIIEIGGMKKAKGIVMEALKKFISEKE